MNAATEWSALPATEMFLRDFRHDSDFPAFMSIWFYEEQKHSLVLMEYLRASAPTCCPAKTERTYAEFDHGPAAQTILHSAATAPDPSGTAAPANVHRAGHQGHLQDPVARRLRHGGAYLKYMKRPHRATATKPAGPLPSWAS